MFFLSIAPTRLRGRLGVPQLAVCFAAALTLSLSLMLLPAFASGGIFTPLGHLPGGGLFSGATGVSDNGTVVVGYSDSGSSDLEAFRWTSSGGMTLLGFLPTGAFSAAQGVSADGSVAVGASDSASGFQAFRWAGGLMTGLGTLPADTDSYASGVSANGLVVVGVSELFDGAGGGGFSAYEAFRWTGGVMTGLGYLPGGGFDSDAYSVSANGSVVVGASDSTSGYQAFRWTQSGGMSGLGYLPDGDSYSIAYGVSDNGSVVVGESDYNAGSYQAFRWTASGGMIGLGHLPGGSFESIAYDVSANGLVVVGESDSTDPFNNEAFVWDQSNGMGMRRLVEVLSANGATGLTNWTLTSADAISPDGSWVVGTGINPDGNEEAFLANIAPPGFAGGGGGGGSLDGLTLLALGLLGWLRRKVIGER